MKRIIPLLLLCLLLTGCGLLPAQTASEASPEALYQEMLGALQTGSEAVTLKGDHSEEALKAAYDRVRNEHPELFWLGASWTATKQSSLMGTTVILKPACYGTKEDNLSKLTLLRTAAEALQREAKERGDLYEQILYVHDALIQATAYDTEGAEGLKELSVGEVLLSSTAYGCLVDNKAICSGYAAAFQYLMNLLEVPCLRVTGSADGVAHEWNVIAIDGKSYHVDLTWDDPLTADGERLCRDYFCIGDEELHLTHTVDAGQELPVCDGDRSWFSVMGYCAEAYETQAVAEILRSQADRGEERLFIKYTKNGAANAEKTVKPENLQALADELGFGFASYRINRAKTVVELVLNKGEK